MRAERKRSEVLTDEHRARVAGRFADEIVVLFMLAAATALGSLLFVRLAALRYLTPAHRLRRYLL